MKIQHNLEPLMKKHDFRSLVHLSERSKLDYRKLYSFAKYRNKYIDPDVLEGLCQTFKCEVGDILVYKKGVK
ncbi:hypothetical protein HMPREF3291_05165 [Bacillus sp. HMSC76G11]|nr:hypothetical protein HMPREF3291_05165 [Bacillus sp. HMSC76G11]